MAKHTGRSGKAKLGANFVGGLTAWSIDETAENIDLSDADDAWADGGDGIKAWTCEVTVRLNHADTAQAAVRAGDVLALEMYSEGDASGKDYFSGNAHVDSMGVSSPHDGGTERTYSCTGRGALAKSTVA